MVCCFRFEKTEKIVKKLRATFKQTLFGDDVSIVPFSCVAPSNDDVSAGQIGAENFNKQNLMSTLRSRVVDILESSGRTSVETSAKCSAEQFLFVVDHCFSIKGVSIATY